MNPLNPSPYLLRILASQLAGSENKVIRGWVDEMTRHFAVVSVVETFRNGKLCGYEVWRHLASRRKDPTRRKARLWFGLRPQHLGGETVDAHGQAKRAANWLATLSDRELIAWSERQRIQREQNRRLRAQKRSADREHRRSKRLQQREERRRAKILEREERKRERRCRVRGVRPQWKDGRVVAYSVFRTVNRIQHRLWFGVTHWRSELGYDGAARDVAEKAAHRLFAMTETDLRSWSRRKPNARNRAVPEHMDGVFIDFRELQQMSHVYASAS